MDKSQLFKSISRKNQKKTTQQRVVIYFFVVGKTGFEPATSTSQA